MQEKSTYSRLPLIICSISAFVTPFMGSAVNIALPPIGREMNMSAMLLTWVATVYNLAAAMLLLPLGRLADIKGREKIFKIGMVFFTLSSLACGLAWNSMSLVIFRFLQGIGGAMIFGTSNAILSASYPEEERGKMLGVYVSCLYFGITLGPTLGGVITDVLGWRSMFFFVTALALAGTALAVLYLPNKPLDSTSKLDMPGSVVCCVSYALLMFGFSELPKLSGALLLAGGIVGFLAFGLIETKVASPVLNIRVFSGNTPFIFANLAELVGYAATFAQGFLLSFYLQYIKGMNPAEAGVTTVIVTVMMVLLSKYSGGLSDKIDPAIIASCGMTVTAIGFSSFIFIRTGTPVWFIVACLGVVGLGLSFFTSPITNAVMSSVEKQYFGVASATLASMRQLGMNLSMGIIMMLFSIIMGETRITPRNYGAFLHCMRIAFGIFTVLCLLAVTSLLAKGRARKKTTGDQVLAHS